MSAAGPVADALEATLGRRPRAVAPIAGGDVCAAFRVELEGGERLFAKSPHADAPGMVSREAEGLRWLAAARALRVPEAVAAIEAEAGRPAVLVLEWIEPGRPGPDFDARLGAGLAALHAAGAARFGGARDGFLGPLPLANAPRPTWARFYAEQRLRDLARQAAEAGRLDAALRRRVEAVAARMEALVGPEEPPARLHGDLWAGNRMADADGRPVLVDPAAYGGHREVDLAMMRLFGGFGPRCFAAYEEAAPLAAGAEARVPLYQLLPLLVHVALFGGGYRASLADALARVERLAG